jgi:hypothetical protein
MTNQSSGNKKDFYLLDIVNTANPLNITLPTNFKRLSHLALNRYFVNIINPSHNFIKISCPQVNCVFNENAQPDMRITFIPIMNMWTNSSGVLTQYGFTSSYLEETFDLASMQNNLTIYFTDENNNNLTFTQPYNISFLVFYCPC